MIVKILSSASNFEGIDYNERKNDKGVSELLLAQNFDALGHSSEELNKSDYINYMKMVASLNSRVKNNQFHAVISSKGREHSPEELKNIAVQYLEKMGYGNNPYLIYAHSDTPNNHVHLVSTRVGKDGKKISDKFEKIRSQSIIQEIMKMDPKQEVAAKIDHALRFNFSSIAQFKLILEREGVKIKEEDNKLRFIKYGKVQVSLDKETAVIRIKDYQAPDERIKQLKALFHKYKTGLDRDAFFYFMKEKFGIEIILHQAQGKEKPYGYSIIDNAGKQVLKGGQVMHLDVLLANSTIEEKLAKANTFITTMLDGDSTFSGLRREMKKIGLDIDNNGKIGFNGDGKNKIQLNKGLLLSLKYNDRVAHAARYSISDERAKQVLARLFFVKQQDLTLNLNDSSGKYHGILQNIIDPGKTDDVLASLNIRTVKLSGNFFLIDDTQKEVVMVEKELLKNLDLDNLESIDLEIGTEREEGLQKSIDYNGSGMLGHILGTISETNYSGTEERKKKKIKI